MADQVQRSPAPHQTVTAQPTPIPVRIIGDDPFYSHLLPIWAFVVACIGMLFGGLALVGIYLQIRRADQANAMGQRGYDKTLESVELAQKDYDATQKALKIAEEQAALANEQRTRKPDLIVSFAGFEKRLEFNHENVILEFEVFNAGPVMAENVNVEIYFPMKFANEYDEDDLYDDVGLSSRPLTVWRESTDFARYFVRKNIPMLNPRDTTMGRLCASQNPHRRMGNLVLHHVFAWLVSARDKSGRLR